MFSNKNKYHPVSADILSEYNSLRSSQQSKRLCHAPFKSLRFSQSGNVLACCFNRGHIIGKVPEHSIHDMWFGNNLSELRTQISNNDLTLGCGECSRRLESRLYNLSGAKQYDYLSAFESSRYPAMFDFEIDNTCNLECVMCLGENSSSIRKNREKLPPYKQHYDGNFVEQLKEFIPHLKEARFSGGEPFLIPLYYSIWEQFITLNPSAKISILTNATVLNERIKDFLSKGDFRLSVSIDSLVKETYEKIRLNADFDAVMENLEYFYSYSIRKSNGFSLNVCPMQCNWQEIPAIVRYCNHRDIQLVLHTVVFPPSQSIWAMGSIRLKEILKFLENENIVSDTSVGKQNISSYMQFVSQVNKWTTDAVNFETIKIELLVKKEKELLELLGTHIYHPSGDYATLMTKLIAQSVNTEEERKTILINLIRFSPDLIISELIHNEPEKLMERLKLFSYTEK